MIALRQDVHHSETSKEKVGSSDWYRSEIALLSAT